MKSGKPGNMKESNMKTKATGADEWYLWLSGEFAGSLDEAWYEHDTVCNMMEDFVETLKDMAAELRDRGAGGNQHESASIRLLPESASVERLYPLIQGLTDAFNDVRLEHCGARRVIRGIMDALEQSMNDDHEEEGEQDV